MASGLYDHGYALLYERVSDHRPGQPGAPRHRLWRVRAGEIVLATGAIERPMTFANNDLPGVMLAGAVRDYIRLWGVLPGRNRAVVFANNDDAYRTALALARGRRLGRGGRCSDPRPRARCQRRSPIQGRSSCPCRARRGERRWAGAGSRRARIAPLDRPDGGQRNRLRPDRRLGRLVACRPPLVPLRRQAFLGRRHGRMFVSPMPPARPPAPMAPRWPGCVGAANGAMTLDRIVPKAPRRPRKPRCPAPLVHPRPRQIRPWHQAFRRFPERRDGR